MRATIKEGTTMDISAKSLTKILILPPKYPLIVPIAHPTITEVRQAEMSTVIVLLKPTTIRAKMSLPRSSVPRR